MRYRPVAVLALVAVGLAGCGLLGGDDDAACGGKGERVAVVRNVKGTDREGEVVVTDTHGRVEQVTGDWNAGQPSFSPDGERLVVVKSDGNDEGAPYFLGIVNADGSDAHDLTPGPRDSGPAWSPDGKTIAYTSLALDRGRGTTALMAVDATGGEARTLVSEQSIFNPASDAPPAERGTQIHHPAWSPDGRVIAFLQTVGVMSGPQTTSIWIVNADGSNRHRVADVPNATSLDWHPNRKTLLASTREGSASLVDVDRGTRKDIEGNARLATWSRTGDRVFAYVQVGTTQDPSWRLTEGRITGRRLRRVRYVPKIEDWYLYDSHGIAVAPCRD